MNIIKSAEKSVNLTVAREIEVPITDDDTEESGSSLPSTPRSQGSRGKYYVNLLSVLVDFRYCLRRFLDRLSYLI